MKLLPKHHRGSYLVAVISLAFFLVASILFISFAAEARPAEPSVWVVSLSLLSSLFALACLYFDKRSQRRSSAYPQSDGSLARVAQTMEIMTERIENQVTLDKRVTELREQVRVFVLKIQTAREEERASIAREIHDELGQKMTRLKIGLSITRDNLKKRRSRESISKDISELERSLALVDGLMRDVRRIATELRPEELDELGLVDAVRRSVDQYVEQTGLYCRFRAGGRIAGMDKQKSSALFRIFQEAMTNVVKHSGASVVDVRLSKYGGRVTLEVADNGRGIGEGETGKEKGLGILGMRERALSVGGTFTIGRAGSGGTAVKVEVDA